LWSFSVGSSRLKQTQVCDLPAFQIGDPKHLTAVHRKRGELAGRDDFFVNDLSANLMRRVNLIHVSF
jgi:hypothetical protein